MKTIKENVTEQLEEKRSKFISDLCHVNSVEEAENKLQEIRKKYYDAKHHCFAYRILENGNIIEKASDDGEPSGTAGAPMLNILQKNELCNIIVVVTRYFGGILLGTGGLVRAYTQVAKQTVESAVAVTIEKGLELQVMLSYQEFETFKHYCEENQINIIETKFLETICCNIETTFNEKEKLVEEIEKKSLNIQNIEIVKEKNIIK